MDISHKQGKAYVGIWSFFLILFYALVTTFITSKVHTDKTKTIEYHKDRINAGSQEAEKTWVNPATLYEDKGNPATKVKIGIYIDHIVELSTKETSWTVDFYVWFKWKDKNIQPGETFQVINGDILSCKKIHTLQPENESYELYRVVAKITKFFNVTRYPRDNHLLTISIEDSRHPWQQLQYIPEIKLSNISSRLKLPDYKINKTIMVSKPHPYKTNRGDPRFKSNHMTVHDQIIYGLEISRPDWGLYFKMFQPLFASVAIAFLVFLINPKGDGRVGLGIGAFFSAVASSYITTTELPGVGILTLSDMINILGLATIFLSVLCSVIVMHIVKNEKYLSLANLFDRVSLGIFLTGYIIANTLIAQVASKSY